MKLAAPLLLAACLSAQAQAQVQPPIVLDGQYSARTDEMSLQIIGDRVCFAPDKAQWGRLPVKRHEIWHRCTKDLAQMQTPVACFYAPRMDATRHAPSAKNQPVGRPTAIARFLLYSAL